MFTRWFVVVALCFISISCILPSIGRFWSPLADLGFNGTQEGWVTSVAPDSPASRAGLRRGDRVDMARTPPESRYAMAGAPLAWRTYTLSVFRGGRERVVRISPVAEQLSLSTKIALATRQLAAIVMPLSGAVLLLMRPSLMTWALFIFLVGAGPGSDGGFWALIPYVAYRAHRSLLDVLVVASFVGAMVFMIVFPTNTPVSRWSAALLKAAPWIAVVMALSQVYNFISVFTYWPVDWEIWALQISLMLCLFAGTAAFAERYTLAKGPDRARIRWVGAGLAVGIGGMLLGQASEVMFPGVIPYGPRSYLNSMAALVPFTVLYAVLKHHVIDVRFFAGRAIVYTALTGGIVLLFSLMDWFFSKRCADSGVGTGVDVLVAIGLGFSLNGLHARLDRFVDNVFFRDRHNAELRLQRAARTLHYAPSLSALHQLLIATPYEALHLESAALFHRDKSGAFVREYALGWNENTSTQINGDDTLVLHLESEREAMRPGDLAWHGANLPAGPARPVIALPVFLRQRLEAVVLFGPHRNGADIDPDEQRTLTALAAAAGAAYDHIDAENVRAEMEQMRVAYSALRSMA